MFDHAAVRAFLRRRRGAITAPEVAGTPAWCALPDDDPGKLDAVLIAGAQHVLTIELDEVDARRCAMVQAAKDISTAKKWKDLAVTLRRRDEAIRSGTYIERVAA